MDSVMETKLTKNIVLLVFMFLLVSGQYQQHPYIEEDSQQTPANLPANISKSITLTCCEKDLRFQPEVHQNLTLECTLPCTRFADYLSTLNATKLKNLTLNIKPPTTQNITMDLVQFSSLNVSTLVINYMFNNDTGKEAFLQLSSAFIYILQHVEILELSGIEFIEDTVTHIDNTTMCQSLHTLRIKISNLKRVPMRWLQGCLTLLHLHLSKMRQRNATKEVRRKILSGLKSLQTLSIQECYIEELNDELADLQSLQKLDVSHNQIHYALTDVVLPSLVELNLSYNHIFSSALLASGVETQVNLRTLILDHNQVLDICDSLDSRSTVDDEAIWHQSLRGRRLKLSRVEHLSLRGSITAGMCFGGVRADQLRYLGLGESKISVFQFDELPKSKAPRLEVNVAGCPITDLPRETFTEDHYNQLSHEELIISGLNVTLACDCDDHLWLSRAVRGRRVVLARAVCRSGLDLANEPLERFQCSRYECGECTCRRYWQSNLTDVECHGELRVLPRLAGLRRLEAPGNLVENVTVEDIPDTLEYLDLSKNHVARMSEAAVKLLLSPPRRHVRLYGNPIICDCENAPFILELMDHFLQVDDYSNLTCIDDGRLVSQVDPGELCLSSSRVFWTALASSLVALVGVAALLAGLYWRHGRAIKVYLYSRGLCLCCIKELEIDADRPYDAFVSFSHKDEQFVTENILPGLENEPYNYKICVHYRNWVAGELIPNQINKSVEESKRSIIILSKNFLESVWGLLEFRTAHLSALKEGRSRVIIVVLGDILNSDDLDGELRSYLKTNTYVKWGDPWFWDKLRYALPHRDITVEKNKDKETGEENLGFSEVSAGQRLNQHSQGDTASTDSAIEMERRDRHLPSL